MNSKTARRIVIGDVHGHFDGLLVLLDKVAPNKDDKVYFLGDLIDRGPQSSNVVELVKKNSYVCLLGNHEQLLLDSFPNGKQNNGAMTAWFYSGGRSTMASYKGNSDLFLEHLNWLSNLPLYVDLGDVWLVHAGVDPTLPLEKQSASQFCWVREQFHSINKPYFSDKLIIIGHTITFTLPGVAPGELAQGAGWLDIDTGVYHPISGWLTALDLTNRLVYQVNVFQHKIRTLSWEEAVRTIEPQKVLVK
ncbi:MAG TPA: metallophosphoesterase family protein [Halomicronema sp.]